MDHRLDRTKGQAISFQKIERSVTEEDRSEVVKAFLENGFTIPDIWRIAPALLEASPGSTPTVSFPIPV